jgi:hypothetical protein
LFIIADAAIAGTKKANKRNDKNQIAESSNSLSGFPLVFPLGNTIECDVGGEPPNYPFFNGDSQGTVRYEY